MGETQLEESEATNRQISSNTKSNSELFVEKTFERPEWLPDGWNVDFKTRKSGSAMGQGYKCYINPHGKKFYSKLEVLRYLETIKGNNCNSRKEESNTIRSPTNDAPEKPMVETSRTENSIAEKSTAGKPRGEKSTAGKPRGEKSTTGKPRGEKSTTGKPRAENSATGKPRAEKSPAEKPGAEKSTVGKSRPEKSTAEDLPSGWIIEAKERKSGDRKDLFYIDPESGYVFRSKKDALRYLESGDISSCVIKPFKRDIQDEDKLSPTSTVKTQEITESGIKRQLFAGKEISDESSLELPDANSSGKRQHVEVSSGLMPPSVPTAESIGQIQLLKNGVAYPPKTKKTSDPDDVQNKNHVVNVVENASKKNHSNPTVSKNRGFSVAHRSSPRLAAAEPDKFTNSLTSEQCLEVPRRNLRRGSRGLASDDHILKESKLLASEIAKSGEICSDLNKSSNKKEPSVPRRASKRLAGSEPELMSNSLSYERAPEYNKSKKSKSGINTNLVTCDGEAGVKLVEHVSMNESSSTRGRKHPQTLPVTKDKLDKHKHEEMNDEKSELQQSLAFHYSWSDPSLEFAIKTLTGTLPAEDSVGNRPTMISETDKLSENDVFKNVTGSSSDRKPKVNPSKPKKKKEPKVPTRLSKRLSGHDPEVLPTETPPEYSTRKSGKNKPDANEILTNGATGPLHAGEEESNLIVHASDMLKTSKCGESSNGDDLYKSQTIPNEQQRGPEAESINERSEPQQFGDNWSDPCVEFAVKTLTASVTVDAANVPVVTLDVNDPPNEELLENAVQKSSNVAPDNNNHCQIKEVINAPVCRPSEQCLGQGQPELRSNPTSYQSDPAFESRVSCGDEGKITRNSDGGQSLHVEAGNMTQIDINTLFFDDPFTEDEQILEDNSIAEQAQPGTEATNRDNTEREFCVSFMDTWSDPCLEFAFKTLTGDIQVEENMAGQGCFPEHANRHDQRNGGSTLPEIGSSSISRSHMAEKSVPPQPPSMSPSFLSRSHIAEKSVPPQPPSMSHSFLSRSHIGEESVPPQQPPSMSHSFLSRSHIGEESVPPQQPPSMSHSFLSRSHIAEKSVPPQPPSMSHSFLSRSHMAEKSVPPQPSSMSHSFLSLSHMAEKSGPAQPSSMSPSFLSLSHIADKPMPAQQPSMSPSFFPPTQQPSVSPSFFPPTQQPSMNPSIFPQEKSSQQHTGADAQRHYSQYNINFQRR